MSLPTTAPAAMRLAQHRRPPRVDATAARRSGPAAPRARGSRGRAPPARRPRARARPSPRRRRGGRRRRPRAGRPWPGRRRSRSSEPWSKNESGVRLRMPITRARWRTSKRWGPRATTGQGGSSTTCHGLGSTGPNLSASGVDRPGLDDEPVLAGHEQRRGAARRPTVGARPAARSAGPSTVAPVGWRAVTAATRSGATSPSASTSRSMAPTPARAQRLEHLLRVERAAPAAAAEGDHVGAGAVPADDARRRARCAAGAGGAPRTTATSSGPDDQGGAGRARRGRDPAGRRRTTTARPSGRQPRRPARRGGPSGAAAARCGDELDPVEEQPRGEVHDLGDRRPPSTPATRPAGHAPGHHEAGGRARRAGWPGSEASGSGPKAATRNGATPSCAATVTAERLGQPPWPGQRRGDRGRQRARWRARRRPRAGSRARARAAGRRAASAVTRGTGRAAARRARPSVTVTADERGHRPGPRHRRLGAGEHDEAADHDERWHQPRPEAQPARERADQREEEGRRSARRRRAGG